MTLADFLLARIADERQIAEDAASEGTPHRTGWQLWTSKVDTTPGGERLGPRGSVEASPARALAECEAKRRIVRSAAGYADMGWVDENPARIGATTAEEMLTKVLCLLALPYADHPDYRQEWRP